MHRRRLYVGQYRSQSLTEGVGRSGKSGRWFEKVEYWQTPRFLFALAIGIGGAITSALLDGPFERIIVVAVSVLVALFVATDPHQNEDANAPVEAEIERIDPNAITSHPRLQAFIDASQDAILIVNDARVAAANHVAQQLLGSHIVGQNVRIAFRHAGAIERLSDPDAEHSGLPIRLSGIGQPGQLWDMRIQSIGPAQKLIHLADRSGALATEQMRVDFVANASHELLTPLAAVKGFIETLDDPAAAEDKETRQRFLGIMAKETDRMQALVRDLMSLSRIEAEKYDPPQTPVDFTAILTDSVEQSRNAHKERGDDIRLDIANDALDVIGDAGQLRQLVSNIVTNAMKYGRIGTPVTISLQPSRSGEMVSFSVADEGDGIPPEHLPRLTERFYRVDSGRSRSVGGTGLGLSLVKHIVDRHRGHLEIRSILGKGTTVSVLLPAAPKQP
jgi:two-component system, OmpR family, phosphate regulon sensor histidine kinase PhoR